MIINWRDGIVGSASSPRASGRYAASYWLMEFFKQGSGQYRTLIEMHANRVVQDHVEFPLLVIRGRLVVSTAQRLQAKHRRYGMLLLK